MKDVDILGWPVSNFPEFSADANIKNRPNQKECN
jgi:hypothetical protein